MEMLVAIPLIILAVGWFIECRRLKKAMREVAAERRTKPKPKPSSWDGSAEQKMLHNSGEMGRSQAPY